MSTRFTFEGLEELKEQLRNLPADLTAEASRIVEGAANGAAADIKGEYGAHVLSGDLRDHVTVTHFEQGKFSAGAIVKAASRHAWLFENGSRARHYISVGGTSHLTGAMPAHPTFIPAMQRARRLMWQQIAELLTSHGLQVSGDA